MSHLRPTLSVSALLTSGAEEFCVGSWVGGVMCTAGCFAASLEDAISNLPTPQSCNNETGLQTLPDVPWGQNCLQLRTAALDLSLSHTP